MQYQCSLRVGVAAQLRDKWVGPQSWVLSSPADWESRLESRLSPVSSEIRVWAAAGLECLHTTNQSSSVPASRLTYYFLADSQTAREWYLMVIVFRQLTIPVITPYNLAGPTKLTLNIECEAGGAISQSEAFLCLIQCKQSSPDWDFIWPSSALILRFTSLALSLRVQSSHFILHNKEDDCIKGFHFSSVAMEVIYIFKWLQHVGTLKESLEPDPDFLG